MGHRERCLGPKRWVMGRLAHRARCVSPYLSVCPSNLGLHMALQETGPGSARKEGLQGEGQGLRGHRFWRLGSWGRTHLSSQAAQHWEQGSRWAWPAPRAWRRQGICTERPAATGQVQQPGRHCSRMETLGLLTTGQTTAVGLRGAASSSKEGHTH